MIGGRVLDTTAINDLTIGRTIYGAAFLAAANEIGIALAIPATALQEAWAIAEVDDHPFLDLLLGLPLTIVEILDTDTAQRSGLLSAAAHAGNQWNAGTAHAALVSRDRGWPVLTAEPAKLRALDPEIQIDPLPDGP
jgi:hypothetical protein